MESAQWGQRMKVMYEMQLDGVNLASQQKRDRST